MPRAKRYFDSGLIWHITHRCHKKEFLLKFARDRKRYLEWLYHAKKRYGIKILNYMVTSNHIHLLVINNANNKHLKNVISRSIQLIAGRTAQEYNQRKMRKGAYWEDRYHTTAIDSDTHFFQCVTYIDMNMVRAAVVDHPKDWIHCGYNELLLNRKRYAILDMQSLLQIFCLKNSAELIEYRRLAIENAILKNHYSVRDPKWTESVAVGSRSFLEKVKKENRAKSRGRKIQKEKNSYLLREARRSYMPHSTAKNEF